MPSITKFILDWNRFVKRGLTFLLQPPFIMRPAKEESPMNESLKKIHDYLLSLGVTQERIEQGDCSTVYLAEEIMEYAHRNQKRENGERYSNHPWRVLEYYGDLVGIDPDDCFCIDKDTMVEHGIPFEGVQEICLLHDVIEDTEFTIEDVKSIYEECHFKDYFEIYIEDGLRRIAHDKNQDYPTYIGICLGNPVSALAKMLDLQDNLRLIDLVNFDKKKQKRALDYVCYIAVINNQCHFLEGVAAYKKEMGKSR